MTTDELLAHLRQRDVRIYLDEDGKPHVNGSPEIVLSEKFKRVLRWHRPAILERLRPKPPREFMWRFGHRYTDRDNMPADWFPVGAFWFRFEGETEWRPVLGRNSENVPVPVEVA